MTNLNDIKKSVIEGDLSATQDQVNQAVAEKIPPETILKEGLIAAMSEVGRMFEDGEFYVPEMLISARAMKGGLAILRPLLASANIKAIGKVIIGTVQGDLHDIGKNLVGMMLEGAGFEVIDLGVDVSPEKYVAAVLEYHPDLVCCSALLTTTMPRMKDIVQALRAASLRDSVKVMIGGAPVTQSFADSIGADGYGRDASTAVSLARQLLGNA